MSGDSELDGEGLSDSGDVEGVDVPCMHASRSLNPNYGACMYALDNQNRHKLTPVLPHPPSERRPRLSMFATAELKSMPLSGRNYMTVMTNKIALANQQAAFQ